MIRLLFAITFAISSASAFHININETPAEFTRRDLLQQTASLALLAISTARPANADVIRSPGKCANGEGEGCDSLAEGNDLIRSLQKKSSENREANQREALNAYYMKNYPDVFAVYDKRMVKKIDGSFTLYSTEEVATLMRDGKIKIEYATSKGGRISDLTQKPILVLYE